MPPLNTEFCFYKYRSPEMGKTLQAIQRFFRGTDVGSTACESADGHARGGWAGAALFLRGSEGKHLRGWNACS